MHPVMVSREIFERMFTCDLRFTRSLLTPTQFFTLINLLIQNYTDIQTSPNKNNEIPVPQPRLYYLTTCRDAIAAELCLA